MNAMTPLIFVLTTQLVQTHLVLMSASVLMVLQEMDLIVPVSYQLRYTPHQNETITR